MTPRLGACVFVCAIFALSNDCLAALRLNDVVRKLQIPVAVASRPITRPEAASSSSAGSEPVPAPEAVTDLVAIKSLETNSATPLAAADLNKVANASTLIVARTGTEAVAKADGSLVVPLKFASVIDSNARVFAPVAILANGGFRYEPDKGTFIAKILIGLQDAEDVAASYSLGRPVELTFAGAFGAVEPQQLAVDHINQPYKEVLVSAQAPQEPVALQIYSALDKVPIAIPLSVLRPTLQITITPKRILGFGLEVADVRVSGNTLENPKGIGVALENFGGRLASSLLELNASGQGYTTIRSIGVGRVAVSAKGLPYADAVSDVEFTWPWSYLIAIMLGGAVGSVISWKSSSPFLQSLLTGCAVGLLATTLYAVGINVFSVTPTANAGEALALALSGLGAVIGPKIFKSGA